MGPRFTMETVIRNLPHPQASLMLVWASTLSHTQCTDPTNLPMQLLPSHQSMIALWIVTCRLNRGCFDAKRAHKKPTNPCSKKVTVPCRRIQDMSRDKSAVRRTDRRRVLPEKAQGVSHIVVPLLLLWRRWISSFVRHSEIFKSPKKNPAELKMDFLSTLSGCLQLCSKESLKWLKPHMPRVSLHWVEFSHTEGYQGCSSHPSHTLISTRLHGACVYTDTHTQTWNLLAEWSMHAAMKHK